MLEEIVNKLKNGADDLDIRDLQVRFAKTHPEQILQLTIGVLDASPNCRRFESSMLGLMPLSDWDLLVAYAIKKFQDSEIAEEIIRFAALQKPDSLHPYLETFNISGKNAWKTPSLAWRGSGLKEQARLVHHMQSSDAKKTGRIFAFSLLLATRDEQVIWDAIEKARAAQLFWDEKQGLLPLHLEVVGLKLNGGSIEKLHSDEVLHIAFPVEYFAELESGFATRDKDYNPTWQLQEQSQIRPDAIIGGLMEAHCKICLNKLHRLIEITNRSVLSDFYRNAPLTFVTCLTCQGKTGMYELFFAHGPSGEIAHLYEGEPIAPEVVEPAFAYTEVNLVDNGPRWTIQDATLSNSWENLHRVGGSPTWVQDTEYLKCPKCSKTMYFAAQIDSGLKLTDGSEWMWGDSGICYLYFCGACSVTGVTYQCY